MEETLNALGGILLNALPTFLLIIILHFYLKSVLFRPLEKVLRERDEATTGLRRKAAETIEKAGQKTREYEEKLRAVRFELYREQEEMRKQWKKEQDAQLAETAARTKQMVAAARVQIAAEAGDARRALDAESRFLAVKIADTVLERRPL
ncbi:MAG: hypothetical protein HY235_16600 [Acidobacteria bacterium]|nr:hypothetical protein [Acidobacteriota bacterium]